VGSSKIDEVVKEIKSRYWLLQNASFWILLGVFIGITYFILIETNLGGDYTKFWAYGLSAMVTLFASGVALAGVFSNIENQNKTNRENRTQALLASKALLPLALSQLHQIAEQGTSFAFEDDSFFRVSENGATVRERLDIDEATIAILKECMELSDDTTRKWMTVLLSRYQISRSRLVGSVESPFDRINNEKRGDHAFEWELIRAIVNHLFAYSRDIDNRTSPKMHINIETISMPITHAQRGSNLYQELQERIRERRSKLLDGSVESILRS
jgi:hypothetical protein